MKPVGFETECTFEVSVNKKDAILNLLWRAFWRLESWGKATLLGKAWSLRNKCVEVVKCCYARASYNTKMLRWNLEMLMQSCEAFWSLEEEGAGEKAIIFRGKSSACGPREKCKVANHWEHMLLACDGYWGFPTTCYEREQLQKILKFSIEQIKCHLDANSIFSEKWNLRSETGDGGLPEVERGHVLVAKRGVPGPGDPRVETAMPMVLVSWTFMQKAVECTGCDSCSGHKSHGEWGCAAVRLFFYYRRVYWNYLMAV